MACAVRRYLFVPKSRIDAQKLQEMLLTMAADFEQTAPDDWHHCRLERHGHPQSATSLIGVTGALAGLYGNTSAWLTVE
jgi:hypothetical protein